MLDNKHSNAVIITRDYNRCPYSYDYTEEQLLCLMPVAVVMTRHRVILSSSGKKLSFHKCASWPISILFRYTVTMKESAEREICPQFDLNANLLFLRKVQPINSKTIGQPY